MALHDRDLEFIGRAMKAKKRPKFIKLKDTRAIGLRTGMEFLFVLIFVVDKNIFAWRVMRDDINCVFEGVAGVGGIFISNLKAAQNGQLLKRTA